MLDIIPGLLVHLFFLCHGIPTVRRELRQHQPSSRLDQSPQSFHERLDLVHMVQYKVHYSHIEIPSRRSHFSLLILWRRGDHGRLIMELSRRVGCERVNAPGEVLVVLREVLGEGEEHGGGGIDTVHRSKGVDKVLGDCSGAWTQ